MTDSAAAVPACARAHIHRPQGSTETTGWQTFTRLRVAIIGGAVLLLVSALVRQVRAVLIARTALGVVLGALIVRRIIEPPDLAADVPRSSGWLWDWWARSPLAWADCRLGP